MIELFEKEKGGRFLGHSVYPATWSEVSVI